MPRWELVVATGDPQGVGPEVAVEAARGVVREDPELSVSLVGDLEVLRRAGADDAWPLASPDGAVDAPIARIAAPAPRGLEAPPPSAEGGAAALAALEIAFARVRADPRRALVTAPLSKEAMRRAGVAGFDGHTAWIASRCGVGRPVMLFDAPGFRVALATVHVPLRRVGDLVTASTLARILDVIDHDLRRRFAVAAPRIHVLGVNPHAGEGGAFGDEERVAVAPAIAAARARGLDVEGPFPADAYFLEGFGRRSDCVLAMYHDQGLAVTKALAFREAVNVTLGLPLVRTSPDHGTAFALAGRGAADAAPMVSALRTAARALRATPPGREAEIPPSARLAAEDDPRALASI
ncbi:MAG TPA: 4-hydroxythreonine-4-phosphate dehydrogenase PdxA [Planctomycetota bacterium]|nr:4-hydroxythreonine-4-phosphate dehydrogenase PdxA [Planctomycetota bacterium]